MTAPTPLIERMRLGYHAAAEVTEDKLRHLGKKRGDERDALVDEWHRYVMLADHLHRMIEEQAAVP